MQNDFPHFRRLWFRVLAALMGSAFIPLVVIGGLFSVYAVSIFKARTVEMLIRDVELRRQNLDRFLSDRMLELKLLARTPSAILTVQETFDDYTRDLILERPWINDLGIFDLDGNLVAYMGHFARQTQKYSDRGWFRQAKDTGSSISDLELGYRQLPHISIAVRTGRDPDLIIRASIDADFFQQQMMPGWDAFATADFFLVSQDGRFQTRPRTGQRPMSDSGLGIQDRFEGTRTRGMDGALLLTTWISSAPWVLAARYDVEEVFAPALEMRYLSVWALIIGGVVIVFFVLLTANTLVSRLETKRERIQHLNRQLHRSSFMTSSMELGAGVLREIGDRLASISVAAQWMETRLAEPGANRVEDDLKQIKESAGAAQSRLSQFLSRLQPDAPMITEVNPVSLLEELVAWLKKELTLRCIRLTWEVDKALPEIRTDRSRLYHAVQNVLLNAVQAVNDHGRIRIAVTAEGHGVAVTITDSGPGIPSSDRERIFEPLYTTKPEGTGLGLPVARDILQALGGSLCLERTSPGATAFRMIIPSRYPAFKGTNGAPGAASGHD